MKKKIIAIIIIGFILILTACSQTPESDTNGTTAAVADKQQETQEAEIDKLAGYDFGGAEIRIHTSINSTDGTVTNSNYMIEGTGEITGEIVNDSVYKRNEDVAKLLNVNFKYTHINEDYNTVQNAISRIIASGMDEYDIMINDLRSLVNLSLQSMFINTKDATVFDLSQKYWYTDFMEDTTIGKDKSYILAGDYFIDILRNSHALFLNKSMLDSRDIGNSHELYKKVIEGKWTFDEFLTLTKDFLDDMDGSGIYRNNTAQFGFICVGTWGSAIPFMIAADTNVFTKDSDGIPELTINSDKSLDLHDYLLQLFSQNSGASSTFGAGELVNQFMNRRSLMVGFQRLATLEDLRMMQDNVSVLPYPKLNLLQKNYITSAHDTIEVGAIPQTTPNFDMICVVLEALNRETERTVIPAYYEQSLKIKYVRDDISAQIIDIIHDSMGNVFPLAYSETISGVLGSYDVGANRNFVSSYERQGTRIKDRLAIVIDQFLDS